MRTVRMRTVLFVVALLALSAAVDVSARRIQKLKQVLDAANSEEAELAVALPFDGDYWLAAKPDVSKTLAAEAKKPQLSTADLLSKFFAPENIQLAQQQGASVQATIATYTATGMLKQCNEGTCDDKWTDYPMTGNAFAGGAGSVVLTCSVPADLKAASCALALYFGSSNSNQFVNCPNAGVAGGKCANPKPTRYSTGAGVWMTNDLIINTAAPNSALQDVYITKDFMTVNFKFFGNDSNRKLTFTTIFLQTSNWAAYKPVLSPPLPAPAAELVAASKAKKLDTAALLKKFFTAENIQLAQQQGQPAITKIATYSATAVTRSCNVGLCAAWAPYEMSGQYFAGNAGAVTLTCSVPADLTKAQCDVSATFSTNTLLTCANIGAPAATCSNPKPTRYSTGAGVWMSNEFITTTVEVAEQYFTADQFVVHFRYRGLDSNRKLIVSDFTFMTANFAGYQYIAQPATPAPAPQLVAASKAKKLDTAAVLKKFFTAENIQLAQQQGQSAIVSIGSYAATAITRSCSNGVCGAWGPYEMSGQSFAGSAGVASLSCSVPADLTKAQCDVTATFGSSNSNTLMSCPNVGGATPTCSNPKPTRYSTGAGVWMTNEFITTTVEVSEVFFAADQMVVHFRFRGLDSNRKLIFSDFTFILPTVNFAFVASPAQPAPAPELVAASKAKALTTSQLLAKFFTSDNIQLAQMQGSTVPVRATIGAYTATAITRSCSNGVCGAYGPYEMSGQYFAGAEGSIALSCSVPADLSKAQCDLTFVFGGNTLMTCPNVGAGGKCSNPKPTRYSTGAGVWMTNEFITTAVEAAEVFFTNDQLAVHFRFRGLDSNRKLIFSDFTALSTPLTDFGVPPKTNCLSKTTADAVIAAATAKKGLKSAIVLQKDPVAALIKSAPYKTVEDAVTAIKGIGPRNVVYVSFMWNFQC